jgi:F-type H+-transporting ATPase subunit gamma
MASVKDLTVRIASVTSTQKITKAMQMVAAAKLRRAQEAAEAARPYSDRMAGIMTSVMSNIPSLDNAPQLLVGNGKDDVHLLIAVTAERGLCGGFNTQTVRAVRAKTRQLLDAGKSVKIFCVGKKGNDALKREYGSLIIEAVTLREVKNVGFANAADISDKIIALFEAGEFDVCTMFYNSFVSVIAQELVEQQLIPLAGGGISEGGGDEEDLGGAIYDFEPEEEELLGDLVPRNLSVQVFKSLLESAAAENAARMTAMDNATRNAGDMIDKLTLTKNRMRQAQITKELIEIISGAEAV